MSTHTSAVLQRMQEAINALALELDPEVWIDVHQRWLAVLEIFSHQSSLNDVIFLDRSTVLGILEEAGLSMDVILKESKIIL